MNHGFFREYWAPFDALLCNQTQDKKRWRVNDETISAHSKWGERWETQAIGLMQIALDEHPRFLSAAEVVLETWGGHPHTRDKRLILNGKATYPLPEYGTAAGHCTYSFSEVPIDSQHMVKGTNSLQFACSRGESFWGHFIIDNAAVRCYYRADHPAFGAFDASDFKPEIRVSRRQDERLLALSLDVAERYRGDIQRVDFFGRYLDFDDRGVLQEDGWHGYMQGRQWRNHIGTAVGPDFKVVWNTEMLPDQSQSLAIHAELTLRDGLKYRTLAQEGIELPPRSYSVQLVKCAAQPIPFWSRAGNRKDAVFLLDASIDHIEKAVLNVRIWDGGEGAVDHPFLINGHPYRITSGNAIHDLIYTRLDINLAHLQRGENTFTLLSDTQHHGIEVLLPGPCVTIKVRAD